MEEMIQLISDIEHRSSDNHEELEFLKARTQNALRLMTEIVHECNNQLNNDILINLAAIYQTLCRRSTTKQSEQLAVIKINQEHECGKVGRPKYQIQENVLLDLKFLGFTWQQIADMLLVSRWTITRRVKEFGIQDLVGYSNISDDELDQHLLDMKNTHGRFVGRSFASGCLQAIGIRVQRKRIMKGLLRIDPESSKIRWACLVKRRKYNVPGPNSLWHSDGHHSLINWGFVIHGGIDGYSRLIVYLKCSTNNKAETVLESFQHAVLNHGIPSRLRTDKGGENVLIWAEMENLRGPNRGSYIAGSSVHNQRIERLWRDVWMYVTCEFYYTFQAMEAEGLLDITNAAHMFILHYIFLPRINHVISSFVMGWNKHPMRTMKNWSPERIWMNGMVDIRNRSLRQVAEIHDIEITEEELLWYGYDPDAPFPDNIHANNVEVFDATNPFNDIAMQNLFQINPLRQSDSFGVDIFLDALRIVSQHQ